MNKWFRPFLYAVITVGFGLFLYSILFEPLPKSVDSLFFVALFLLIAADVIAIEYNRNIAISLGGSLITFIFLREPLILVFLLILLSLVAAHILRSLLDKENSSNGKIFDIKMIYNIAAFAIIAKIASFFVPLMQYEQGVVFILKLALFSSGCCLLNMLFTTVIVSLSLNKNIFREIDLVIKINSIFFSCIIVVLLFLLEHAFELLGIVLFMLFLLPSHGIIIDNRLSGPMVRRKLNKDGLTDILNRGYLEEIIKENLKLHHKFTLLFLDINNFKAINDNFGHLGGDAVLIAFTMEIKKHLRKEDQVFRYGGDEFCILFANHEQAEKYRNRMEELGNSHMCRYVDQLITYSFSMGFLEYDGSSDTSFTQIINEVDRNMYLDKKKKTDEMLSAHDM